MALRAALLGSRTSCSQPFASPAALGSGRAPRGRAAARPAGRGGGRCVRTRAAQAEVSTEKDVAAISDALRQAIAAEDYPLAARLRDELQQLPEVELESQLRAAVEQEDYAVRPPRGTQLCSAQRVVACGAGHAGDRPMPAPHSRMLVCAAPHLPRSPPWQRLPQTHLVARTLTLSCWSPGPADSRALRLALVVTWAKCVGPSTPKRKGARTFCDRTGRAHKGLH
jgi:hypothetical protein